MESLLKIIINGEDLSWFLAVTTKCKRTQIGELFLMRPNMLIMYMGIYLIFRREQFFFILMQRALPQKNYRLFKDNHNTRYSKIRKAVKFDEISPRPRLQTFWFSIHSKKVVHFKIWVVSRNFGQFFTNKTCPEGENGSDMTAALFFWKVMIDIKYVFTTVVVVQMWAYGCCLTGHNKIKHASLSHMG